MKVVLALTSLTEACQVGEDHVHVPTLHMPWSSLMTSCRYYSISSSSFKSVVPAPHRGNHIWRVGASGAPAGFFLLFLATSR